MHLFGPDLHRKALLFGNYGGLLIRQNFNYVSEVQNVRGEVTSRPSWNTLLPTLLKCSGQKGAFPKGEMDSGREYTSLFLFNKDVFCLFSLVLVGRQIILIWLLEAVYFSHPMVVFFLLPTTTSHIYYDKTRDIYKGYTS